MIRRKFTLPPKRERAQSLVEFALVLPLLLLVVYGLLEVGRLIFTYSIVISAAREAVRYGSATGLNVAGGVARYRDCDGIRAAAHNVDFLGVITDANITISYDRGPGGASLGGCPPATVKTGDRIYVGIAANFAPIITMPIQPITVRSSSARTIIVSLTVPGTALPPPTVAPPPPFFTPGVTPPDTAEPTNTLTGSETPTGTPTETGTPTNTFTPSMTFTPSNTPTVTPTPTNTATPVNCSLVTHGALSISGKSLIMTIDNGIPANMAVTQIFVAWNHDKGYSGGTDTSLHLQNITVGGVSIWTGDDPGPNRVMAYVPGAGVTLPQGPSVVVFTFDKEYQLQDGTERVVMQFGNNGCGNYTVDSNVPSCPIPNTVALGAGTRSGNSISLNWTASTGALNYMVFQSTDGTNFSLLSNVAAPTTTYSAALSGGNGTVNYFKIVSSNSCGTGTESNVISVVK
jgi:Flp pilus assembly protein TadG